MSSGKREGLWTFVVPDAFRLKFYMSGPIEPVVAIVTSGHLVAGEATPIYTVEWWSMRSGRNLEDH